MAISSPNLLMVKPATAQATPPSVPEFTLSVADHSHNVPSTTTSSTDPYTGKTTTTTVPGYHVENKTIDAVIKNNLNASYYNFRWKGHFASEWSYHPFDPNFLSGYNFYNAYSVPFQAISNPDNTVVTLFLVPDTIPAGGQVDVQVQALIGNYDAIPYGHFGAVLGGPTYDFIFKGTISNWSDTQTITIPETSTSVSPTPISALPNNGPTSSPTPNPTTHVPEFSWLAVIPLLLSIISVAVILSLRKQRNGEH